MSLGYSSRHEDNLEELFALPRSATASVEDHGFSSLKTDEFGAKDHSQSLQMKDDHKCRPLWISPDGHIFLETFSPVYKQTQDFLITISEPEGRPQFIHEFKLTPYSLYAAVSVGLNTKDIIDYLGRLCKHNLPTSIVKFIEECTMSFGKVKLVLKHNQYFVESEHGEIMQKLLADNIISGTRKRIETEADFKEATDRIIFKKTARVDVVVRAAQIQDQTVPMETDNTAIPSDIKSYLDNVDDDDEDDDPNTEVFSYEVKQEHLEDLQRRCNELEYPLLAEYEFRHDTENISIPIDLKPTTVLRPYQEKSLRKMFGNGRARSGVIVLPCGAGKTLVGITATCTIKKAAMILCTSAVAVEQWKTEFCRWSTIPRERIGCLVSGQKDDIEKAYIVISTYSMVSYTQQRSYITEAAMKNLQTREWGLMVLDEVQTIPADKFRRVLSAVRAHCKLGLTATLVREDDKIQDLNFLIGPKLYEANWMELQGKGYIAYVRCIEIWCKMTAEFYAEYLRTPRRRRKLLYVMNPNKYRTCQYLVRHHQSRMDKIIVFSDNLFALRNYAITLGKPFIDGDTPQSERLNILANFKRRPDLNCIFISKVGDNSFDIPDANVLIQISAHGGSRRQEAQRLGRILRAKKDNVTEGYNAYFYTLISQDTEEMYFSTKRQQFLVNQGYSFEVISNLVLDVEYNLNFSSKKEQAQLLQKVLETTDSDHDTENPTSHFGGGPGHAKSSLGRGGYSGGRDNYTKSSHSLAALSGGDDMTYLEYSSPATHNKKHQHPLFNLRRK
ncbi:XPB protein [Oopsacas minuta]|uniref:General transcription and DNA repair factor IIH helicase/translocase subunit XPB n=1 Tax=Oopsacas minuta TaxID=111878 RepID=A0AAV7K1D9_9METZ|nr:XPB protein [Oopsacas minuta]